MNEPRDSTPVWARALSPVVEWLRSAEQIYRTDRDWWRDAPAERVLRVIAGRMFVISFALLVLAAAGALYARTGDFPRARIFCVVMIALAFIGGTFSARRLGESIVLDRLPYDGETASWFTRSVLLVVVLGCACLWSACIYSVARGRVLSIEAEPEPLTFAIVATLVMFLSTYVLASCLRAVTLMLSSAELHARIRQRIYGSHWRWIKNFRKLD
jgi:hypothetical protein